MTAESPEREKSPELAESVLKTLLGYKEQDGYVSNKDVTKAARVLGCSPRTVRRMIERGCTRKKRQAWEPAEDLTTLIIESKGSIAGTHAFLVAQGKDPGCKTRTMQRWAARHLDQRVLAGARGGYEALRATLPIIGGAVRNINDEWAIDHTKLPVWCLMPDGTVGKPWMTTIIDSASRMILATTISPTTPTVEEGVETIAAAGVGYTTEDGVFVGGKPESLRSDRGGDLISRAMTQGLVAMDIERKFTEGYAPDQNGGIERWHRILKDESCCHIPGFDRSDWTARDPRKEVIPPPRAELLPLATVTYQILGWVRHYNFERPHGALGANTTPYMFWCADDTEITHMDEVAIRASMTQREERKVTKGRIRWDKRFYVLQGRRVDPGNPESDTWRSRLEGQKVQMRYLDSRYEYVEIYTLDGTYATKAVWNNLADEQTAAEVARDRRKAIATLRTCLEDIATQNAESKAALTAAATADNDETAYGHSPSTSSKERRGRGKNKRAKPKSAAARKQEEVKKHQAKEDRETLTDSVLARTGTENFI